MVKFASNVGSHLDSFSKTDDEFISSSAAAQFNFNEVQIRHYSIEKVEEFSNNKRVFTSYLHTMTGAYYDHSFVSRISRKKGEEIFPTGGRISALCAPLQQSESVICGNV